MSRVQTSVQTVETKLVFCLTATIKPVGTIKRINGVQITKKSWLLDLTESRQDSNF